MYYQELCVMFPALAALDFRIPPALDGQFSLQSFPAHRIIHQKDAKLEHVGILLAGTFRVVNELENGNLFMIEINDPISFTGEVTLLSGHGITSVTLETITPCRIAFVPERLFDAWLNTDIRLLRFVSEGIANKLYQTSYHSGERMFYSTKYVLLKYLLEQVSRSAAPDAPIRKTRQQMCEEIGLSVNSINRLLNSFRQEGLLSIARGKILMTAAQQRAANAALRVYLSENRNGTK